MKVEKLMSRPVCSCSPTSTLHEAARAMWDKDCGFLPVVDEQNRVLGVVTDRDICMGALTQGVPLTAAVVSSVMCKELRSVSAQDDIARAERLMRQYRVRRLPVLGPFKQIVGVISLADLARYSQANLFRRAKNGLTIAKTLATVSEPRARRTAAAAE
jgi:CBS domain-containing protein